MNWGNKLILVFVGFAALMGTMVYKAMNTRFELVSKEYYQDELRYQDKIDGRTNAANIGAVTIHEDEQYLVFQFPEEMKAAQIKGEAWLYCKTDAIKDLRFPLTINEDGRQLIERKKLAANKYQLKLSWEAAGKKYYLEKEIELSGK